MDEQTIREGEIEEGKMETTEGMEEGMAEGPDDDQGTADRKVQNLTAVLILVTGLFLGSIFVDVLQLLSGQGFSARALSKADVVEAAGKTWVAYDDPKVTVKVLSDASCEECDPGQAIVAIRRALPTIDAVQVDIDSQDGRQLIDQSSINALPAFFFDANIEKTQFFTTAASLFGDKLPGGWYAVDAARIGMTPGKFLSLPEVGADDLVLGNRDAKVKVVEFSDFQCPYCKAFQPAIKQMLDEYGDRVTYVYKQFPLTSIHPQAEDAALAVECANEQGKWFEYGDNLFAKQDEWGKAVGTQKFKDYARALRLDTVKFSQCLDTDKYADRIREQLSEGEKFGITGTPGTFVNGKFIGGYVGYDDLKKMIDDELASAGQ